MSFVIILLTVVILAIFVNTSMEIKANTEGAVFPKTDTEIWVYDHRYLLIVGVVILTVFLFMFYTTIKNKIYDRIDLQAQAKKKFPHLYD